MKKHDLASGTRTGQDSLAWKEKARLREDWTDAAVLAPPGVESWNDMPILNLRKPWNSWTIHWGRWTLEQLVGQIRQVCSSAYQISGVYQAGYIQDPTYFLCLYILITCVYVYIYMHVSLHDTYIYYSSTSSTSYLI